MQFTDGKIIGDLAVRALKLEAGTTPKPGLVDRANNGAHRDMDYAMFLASSEALRTCFVSCAEIGADPQKLREAGIRGEASMYEATNHVNTHKGLIFSMGIFCGAFGELVQKKEAVTEEAVQGLVKDLAHALLQNDTASKTHGRQVLETTGTGGIRAEAMSGFAGAFHIGLPALRKALAEGFPFERAMVKTLLTLMCQTEDSNLVYRGGMAGLSFVQEHAAAILSHADLRKDKDLELVRAFDEICIEKNLSPGGSADLLALTAMLYLFFEEFEKNERKEGE
ncbi:MAG: triphosphoribosyl-dephospho-CoA synthase [Firmicutes bacterium]|nr:triphosphoribosyl-dephospho-CoA synthase [Bacillota bacterium]